MWVVEVGVGGAGVVFAWLDPGVSTAQPIPVARKTDVTPVATIEAG